MSAGHFKNRWQAFPYAQVMDVQRKDTLLCGDAILIQHPESGGYLTMDNGMRIKEQMIGYVRVNLGVDPQETYSANSFFALEPVNEEERGCCATWSKVALTQDIEDQTRYRVRHLTSGQCLSVEKNEFGLPRLTMEPSPPGKDQEEVREFHRRTIFLLRSNKFRSDNNIRTNAVVKLMHRHSRTYLCTVQKKVPEDVEEETLMQPFQEQDSEEIDEDFIDRNSLDDSMSDAGASLESTAGHYFTKMTNNEFHKYGKQKLTLKKKLREFDVFGIQKVDAEELKDVLFLLSAVNKLRNFVSAVKSEMPERLTSNLYDEIEALLVQLVYLLTKTEDKNPFKCVGIPNARRQKFCREIHLVDLIVDILYFTFESDFYSLSKLGKRHPLVRIIKLVYRVLLHTVSGNTLNE